MKKKSLPKNKKLGNSSKRSAPVMRASANSSSSGSSRSASSRPIIREPLKPSGSKPSGSKPDKPKPELPKYPNKPPIPRDKPRDIGRNPSGLPVGGGREHNNNGPKNNGPKNSGHNKQRHGDKYFGGVGKYKGVNVKKVKRLVNGILKDEIRDLKRGLKEVKRDAAHQMGDISTEYDRAKGDLDHIYKETGDYINHLSGQTNQAYSQQASTMQAANAALQQQLRGTYTGAVNGVNAEMARLGISGAANIGGLAADGAFLGGLANMSGANDLSTLGMMGANSNSLMNLIAGMNQGSYISNLGRALNSRNDQLQDTRQDRLDNINEVRDAIKDVKAGRRDMLNQLLNQLQETGWGQFMDRQQLKMARKQMGRSHKKRR